MGKVKIKGGISIFFVLSTVVEVEAYKIVHKCAYTYLHYIMNIYET